MRFRFLGALGALVAMAAAIVAVPASGADESTATAKYAVTPSGIPPAAGYEGNISGLERTKPGKGQKYNSKSAAAKKYTDYLVQSHDQLLGDVGGADKIYDYTHAVNAVAAVLTEAQAAKLEGTEGVLSVEKAEILQLDTSNTPAFLGLTKPANQGGLWAKLGGVEAGVGNPRAGEDVIIGMVDSGYWPENPKLALPPWLTGSGGRTRPEPLPEGADRLVGHLRGGRGLPGQHV